MAERVRNPLLYRVAKSSGGIENTTFLGTSSASGIVIYNPTPFYTGLISYIFEGVRPDYPFVTGLDFATSPGITSSKARAGRAGKR